MGRTEQFVTVILVLISGFTLSGHANVTAEYFNTVTIGDPRKVASCQNFADYGATYEFKIIDGRVYYKRNDKFMGEFRPDGEECGVYVDNATTRSTGYLDMAEIEVSMISARGNRVMAYSTMVNRFFWALMITEYDKDYHNDTVIDGKKHTRWYSEDACYTKTDPEEATSPTDPPFSSNPNFFYALNLYKNNMTLDTIPELKKLGLRLGGKMPDLADLSTDDSLIESTYNDYRGDSSCISLPAGPVFSNVMQVMVSSRVWQIIDGMPPGNAIDPGLYLSETDPECRRAELYDLNRKRVFHELTGLTRKVVTKLMTSAPPDDSFSTNDDVLRSTLSEMVKQVVDSIQNSNRAFIIKINTDQVRTNIQRINIRNLVEAMLRFYDRTINYALVHYDDMGLEAWFDPYTVFNVLSEKSLDFCREQAAKIYLANSVDILKKQLWECLSSVDDNLGLYEKFVEFKVHAWSNAIADSLVSSLINFRSERIAIDSTTGYHFLDPTAKRWAGLARGLHNWYENYRDPGRYFLLKDTVLAPERYRDNHRSMLDIKEIIDIGINASSRYEHYRFHRGGEYGAFYGKFRGRDSFISGARHDDEKKTGMPRVVDGHGYIDGTVNFYVLAKVGIRDSLGNVSVVPAVLWMDEQEYFSERWRICDPNDNIFEGIGGVFSSAVPVLYWFNGVSPDIFSNSYYTPYRRLTARARMGTSGTAIVIADDDTIYSTSHLWAITDGTWRWRNYPVLKKGEKINRQSLRVRDDMTISFSGVKMIGSRGMNGYWYQQYLGSDNRLKGTPVYGRKPVEGYTHRWHFMGKDAFEYADRHFYRLGLYDTVQWIAIDSGMHYCYKGYFPHTNILAFNASEKLTSNVPARKGFFLHRVRWKRFSVANLVDRQSVINSPDRFDLHGKYYLLNSDGSRMFHPMYSLMRPENRPPIEIKFVKNDNKYYAFFLDPRNDDLDLSETSFKICSVNDSSGKCYTINSNQMTNLNVWADLPIKFLKMEYDSGRQTVACRLFLDNAHDYGIYLIKSVKAGCIENGAMNVITEYTSDIPMATKENGASRVLFSFLMRDVSPHVWRKYFSTYGRAKYGTSIWVEDVLGNGNVVSNIEILD